MMGNENHSEEGHSSGGESSSSVSSGNRRGGASISGNGGSGEAPPVLTSPKTKDVLCGKGKALYEHMGNIHFRQILSTNVNKYKQNKSKSSRMRLVRMITHELMSNGARFLRRSDIVTPLDNENEWCELSIREARNKVGQTLRDMVRDDEQQVQAGAAAGMMIGTTALTARTILPPTRRTSLSSSSSIMTRRRSTGEVIFGGNALDEKGVEQQQQQGGSSFAHHDQESRLPQRHHDEGILSWMRNHDQQRNIPDSFLRDTNPSSLVSTSFPPPPTTTTTTTTTRGSDIGFNPLAVAVLQQQLLQQQLLQQQQGGDLHYGSDCSSPTSAAFSPQTTSAQQTGVQQELCHQQLMLPSAAAAAAPASTLLKNPSTVAPATNRSKSLHGAPATTASSSLQLSLLSAPVVAETTPTVNNHGIPNANLATTMADQRRNDQDLLFGAEVINTAADDSLFYSSVLQSLLRSSDHEQQQHSNHSETH